MSHLIVVFPPESGGNHLKNLIDKRLTKDQLISLYKHGKKTVHAQSERNFQDKDLVDHGLTHGHFGEVMSHQTLLRSINDKKFIILSPDSQQDRSLLYERRKRLAGLTANHIVPGTYWDGEQVFLYEPFMYNYVFGTSFDNIMNISINEWFRPDISEILEKISSFTNTDMDLDLCLSLHAIWCRNNL